MGEVSYSLSIFILVRYGSLTHINASGAVLAAWMRLKYPHVAIGALASSAPILQFEDIVPPDTFYNIVSKDFKVSISISVCSDICIHNCTLCLV